MRFHELQEVDGLVATAGGPADGSGVGGSSGAHETIATAVGPGVGVGAADCNVLRLRGGAGGDKKLAARPAAKGSGGGEAAAAAAAAAAGVHEAVAGESGSDGADEPAAKRARGPDGAAVAADGGKGRRPSGVTPNARAANRRPQSAASRGAGAQTQFAVGDRVEVSGLPGRPAACQRRERASWAFVDSRDGVGGACYGCCTVA